MIQLVWIGQGIRGATNSFMILFLKKFMVCKNLTLNK